MASTPPPDPGRIVGISRTSLWEAWKAVRRELQRATLRDVADFLEYDIDPNVWINRLLKQIANGTYEPQTPWRFTVAKSNGFSRRMTMPAIPDLVLYRTIGTYLQRKLKQREHQHVYFERRDLAKATEQAKADADADRRLAKGPLKQIVQWLMDYESHSKRRKRAWLHYSQYRKLLIFKRVFPFIVTTDITNFFDTVLHDKLAECFHSIAAPHRMIGLLFFLLERLSIREAFSDSPRVGLPVDEFDCSRQLAHLFLYAHDDRVVAQVGKDAFVRWMDDQNIGVPSRADGLKALACVGSSLAQLHLTANAGKSRILSLAEARRHFHLDLNDELDKIEPLVRQKKPPTRQIAKQVRSAWANAKQHEHKGEWDKILKRVYRYAALGQVRMFRRSAVRDILAYPRLADRVADYIRNTGTSAEFLAFSNQLWSHAEQVYPDVAAIIFERLLTLEPTKAQRKQILAVAFQVLDQKWQTPGQDICSAIAPLVVLRFGDKRSAHRLRTFVDRRLDAGPTAAIRACAIVYATFGSKQYSEIRNLAARMFRNPLADTVRLIDRIKAMKDVPNSYKQRIHTDFDPVAGRPYMDMRNVLAARLLMLNTKPKVIAWCAQKKAQLLKQALSGFDRAMIKRLL